MLGLTITRRQAGAFDRGPGNFTGAVSHQLTGARVDDAKRVRQADYAALRGMSRQRVHQLVRDGRIPLDADGLVDVLQADANLAAMLDRRKATLARQMALAAGQAELEVEQTPPLAVASDAPVDAGPPASPEPREAAGASTGPAASAPAAATDYWRHKALREASEAALAEIKLREKRREVCDRAGVTRAIGEVVATFGNNLQQIPAQLAPTLVGIPDPQQVEALLAERIGRAINELAGQLERAA